MIERLFRHAKNLLETRPIFHCTDAAIWGHVFCSFLALKRDLLGWMEKAGIKAEWGDVLRDLRASAENVLTHEGRRLAVHSRPVGVAGKIVPVQRKRSAKEFRGRPKPLSLKNFKNKTVEDE